MNNALQCAASQLFQRGFVPSDKESAFTDTVISGFRCRNYNERKPLMPMITQTEA